MAESLENQTRVDLQRAREQAEIEHVNVRDYVHGMSLLFRILGIVKTVCRKS